MRNPLANIRIVLVRPKFADNIGAVARAMANTGINELVLVAPRQDPLSREARRLSARAEPILHAARTVQRLPDALQDIAYTVGTSCRRGLYREQIEVDPETMAERVIARADQLAVAVLFGTEDHGLTNEELLHCDAVMRIPSSDAYPSLNLAQAVMVTTYELFRAAACRRRAAALSAPTEDIADAATMARLMDKFRRSLLRIRYLHGENPEHLLFPFRAVLARAQITNKEARILMGMAQQIEEYAEQADRSAHPPRQP
jgi:tRNA/rRNA methyltransferase